MAPSRDLGFGLLAVVHPREGFGKAAEPPQVHVYDADGEVKIALDSLKILDMKNMKVARIRKALALVTGEQEGLWEMWNASRPTQ